MSEYRQWISYLYKYEEGTRKHKAGYAKIERNNNECTTTIHMLVSEFRGVKLHVYYYKRLHNKIEGIKIGEVLARNGIIDFKNTTLFHNLMSSQVHFLELNGLILYADNHCYLASQWDEKPITKEDIFDLEKERLETKGDLVESINAKEDFVNAENGIHTTDIKQDQKLYDIAVDVISNESRKEPSEKRSSSYEYNKNEVGDKVIKKPKELSGKKKDDFPKEKVRAASVGNQEMRGGKMEDTMASTRRVSTFQHSMTVEEAKRRHEERVAAQEKKIRSFQEVTAKQPVNSLRSETKNKNSDDYEKARKKEDALLERELRKREELIRQEEIRRQEELKHQEKIRQEEELRQEKEARREEELRQKEEARREEELRQKEEARREEELRQREEARREEELRQREEARREEELRQREEARREEELRQEKEARREEELSRQNELNRQLEERVKKEKFLWEELNRQENKMAQAKFASRLFAKNQKQQLHEIDNGEFKSEVKLEGQMDVAIQDDKKRVVQEKRNEETERVVQEIRKEEQERVEKEKSQEEQERVTQEKKQQEQDNLKEERKIQQHQERRKKEFDKEVRAAENQWAETRKPEVGSFGSYPWKDAPQARNILDTNPRMYPFEDGELAECVRIGPEDIGRFPMEFWELGSNSFIRHAFFNFRHLLFAKKQTRDGCIYLLMVPGVYHPREKYMARMFGFDYFKCVNRKNLRVGEFGYWYIPIDFNL